MQLTFFMVIFLLVGSWISYCNEKFVPAKVSLYMVYGVCVCACVCVRACMRVCVCACVYCSIIVHMLGPQTW